MAVVTTLILVAVQQKEMKKKPETAEDGSKILRHPKFYRFVGIGGMLLGFTLIFLVDKEEGTMGILEALGASLILFIPFLFLFIFQRNNWLKYNQDGLEFNSSFNKRVKMQWKEIQSVKYRPLTQGITFRSEREKFTIYQSAVGLKDFVRELNEQGWTDDKTKIPKNLFGDQVGHGRR